MKILHLLYESKGDYFGIGGVGIRSYEIYKHLKEHHDITLLCKKYPGAIDADIEELKHVFVGTESKSLTKTLLSYAFHAASFVRKHGNEFDIIIEEFSPAIPTFLHRSTEKPIVLQIQGYTGRSYFKKYNPVYALFLYLMEYLRPRFYENFIFISGETVKKLLPSLRPPLTTGGWVHGKRYIAAIPNGISPELLETYPDEGDYILYLGRIDVYGKGLDILLRAYSMFLRSFPSVKLIIAGDGRDMKQFEEELQKLPENERKNIDLSGWISGERKREVLRKAKYVVLPSRHEVQGITALEAMASSKAVIVSDIPELSYVVQRGAGISFESGNSSSLAQSMKTLMQKDERKSMGEMGRSWVAQFTWDKIAKEYENFLCKVVEREGEL